MARITKMMKNTGIMILLLFSMLLAPNSSVSSVPTTTMMWKGITEYSVREKDSNHAPVSTVMTLPVTESKKAFST